MTIKKGDKISVHYIGTFEDGTVFDSSEKHGQPLEFEVGAGMMIKGFDEAVLDMDIGSEKDITLEPKDAYGDPNPDMIKKFPASKLPKEAKEGMVLMMALNTGQQIPAKIAKIEGEEATIDLNHPLAGKTLKFHIKIVSIN